jgi:hypothetical protein
MPFGLDAAKGGSARTQNRAVLAVAFLLSGVMLTRNEADADLWGHVRYGQDVLLHGRIPATATYTFTAQGHPWINHENLSEVVVGALDGVGGGPALALFMGLAGLAVTGVLLVVSLRRGTSPLVAAGAVLLAVINVMPGWSLRPQLFSYGLFLVLLIVLDRLKARLDDPRASRLRAAGEAAAALFVVFVVWTNAHGGFLAGLCTLALAGTVRILEEVRRSGRLAWCSALVYGAVIASACAATLVNPYGLDYWIWLASDLSPPRPEISEWRPLTLGDPAFWPFAAMALVSMAALLFTRRGRDWTQMAVLAATVWQSVEHVRHVPFFALAFGLWLPVHLEDLAIRALAARRSAHKEEPALLRRIVAGAVAAVMFALAWTLGTHLGELRVNRRTFPVDAFQFMADRNVTGRMVVFLDWAQYALAAFGDHSQVAFDGRLRTCYPQELSDMHFDLTMGNPPGQRYRDPQSPPFDPVRVLQYNQPDVVILSRRLPHGPAVLAREQEWTLLYQDALAQVWGRRARFDDPASADFIPPAERQITSAVPTGYARWPAFPGAKADGSRIP